ncbi:MAG: transposase [Ruminococcus sp.]|nr:transposase [Ruminococcus sp.]
MTNGVLSESELEFIISKVLKNAMGAFREDDRSDFSNGRRLAYYEVLDTIKNELIIREIDVSRFGLDINLESLL